MRDTRLEVGPTGEGEEEEGEEEEEEEGAGWEVAEEDVTDIGTDMMETEERRGGNGKQDAINGMRNSTACMIKRRVKSADSHV